MLMEVGKKGKKENNASQFHQYFFFGLNPYKPNDLGQQ